VWFPIHDLNAPTLEHTEPMLHDLLERIGRGEHLLMHCAAGIGRTGMIAACILVRQGMTVQDSLERVRTSRPGAGPEVGPQLDLVRAVAAARPG
jgi:protein-tyrosine phosphatase